MKTIEEVIKTLEECMADDAIESEGLYLAAEALHYLKEYRSEKAMWEADRKGYLDWIEQYKEAREKHQQAVIELLKNPPLTWDELKTMEGKPVWVEYADDEQQTGWALIVKNPERPIFGKPTLFTFVRDEGNFYLTIAGYGKRWQAYRKERE